jgi:hypothetical protein
MKGSVNRFKVPGELGAFLNELTSYKTGKPLASLCADYCLEGNHSRFQPNRPSALLRPSRELSDIGGRRFFFPALGSIEFGNGVGAQFKDLTLDAVALVLAGV